jgi:hypothetical protein
MIRQFSPITPNSDVIIQWLSSAIDTKAELEHFHDYVLKHLREWRGLCSLGALLDNMRASRRYEVDAVQYEKKMRAAKHEARLLAQKK